MMPILKKVHKWVGLLIGIQLLLWLLSGLMLSLLNADKVSGVEWAQETSHSSSPVQDQNLLEPHELSGEQLANALSISLENRRGQAIYRIGKADGTLLINASNGVTLTINEHEAKMLAQQDFNGDGEVRSIERGRAPDLETRRSTGKYWRINFSDSANTSIYISASTGEILERRNSY